LLPLLTSHAFCFSFVEDSKRRMPACASCAQELPRARFSQKQLHKPANVRRCLGCTSALRHAAIAPLANDDDDVLRLMGKALDAMARPKLASAQQAMRGLRRATTFRDASEFLVAHMEGSDDAELLVAVAREIVSAATEEWRNTGLLIGLIELMEDLAIVTRNRIPLPEEGSFELLVDVLKRHPDNAAVVKAVASTLSLNAEDAHDAEALFELGATAHLVRALHDHVQAADVSAVVVKALELLVAFCLARQKADAHRFAGPRTCRLSSAVYRPGSTRRCLLRWTN